MENYKENLQEEDFSLLNELEKMEIVGGKLEDEAIDNLALSNCKKTCIPDA